jgi:L-asparaginase
MKRVHLIHTGGTFGMEQSNGSSNSLVSNSALVQNLLKRIPELAQLATISCSIVANLDSSDMNPEIWKLIAQEIQQQYENHDGFVVIHGTDTLCYTSAALSYFLLNLKKPIVVTGSQRPLSELRNDARTNLIDSVELACKNISKVMVCFDSVVYESRSVTKYSSERMDAFRPVNSLPLAQFGVGFHLFQNNEKQIDSLSIQNENLDVEPLQLDTRCNGNILSLDCTPGAHLSANAIGVLASSLDGIVLRAFGTGNVASNEETWSSLCEHFHVQKKPVVICSQCTVGGVHLSSYENGRQLAKWNVLSAENLSFENAIVRLMVLIGRGLPPQKWSESWELGGQRGEL